MRSPLSQFQTPTTPRRASRFFQVWSSSRLPRPTDHSAYFGLANFIKPTLSAVDVRQLKHSLHRCQRNSQGNREISVNGFVEKRTLIARRLCPPAYGSISRALQGLTVESSTTVPLFPAGKFCLENLHDRDGTGKSFKKI